ncbi:Phosphoribosyl-ATP pyrophosphohydrolase [gamma proteobacterium HdN1]|nr:Phosphoribosyl-ATP pyrophosphohydrolase [gamma proteobacterium HdN1]
MQKKARLSLASLWLLATPALAADLPELVRAERQWRVFSLPNIDPQNRVLTDKVYISDLAGNLSATATQTITVPPPTIELSEITAGIGGFAISGETPADSSGYSVASAGDVNGDGLVDVIVGAFGGKIAPHTPVGRSYIIFGKDDNTAIDLTAIAAGTGGFVINGQSDQDASGISVANAGDVNGDGLADVIIGAYDSDPQAGSGAGRSYVVFGKTSTTAIDLSVVAGNTGGFVINGESQRDASGRSVAGAGDINGDGLADLVVGAPFSDPSGINAGRSYAVFGKKDSTAIDLSAVVNGNGGFVINGQAVGDNSGYSVAGAGDINGDGLADLVIGAYRSDPAATNDAGRTYVVFGKSDGNATDLSTLADDNGGFVINGQASGDFSGYSVASAGDVNGDGRADLIIGAYNANGGNGRSYVVFGKTDATAINLADVANGNGGFVINGQSSSNNGSTINKRGSATQSGYSVSSAGDINGDGLADLLIGAPRGRLDTDSRKGPNVGHSYVVFGQTDSTAIELSAVAQGQGGFIINGESGNEYSGRSVAAAGDVNGDGLADLIIGAPNVNEMAGRSYVIFGSTSGAFRETRVDQLGDHDNNTLSDRGNTQTLVGGAGNDTLTATAASVLYGGSGDDTFVINNKMITALKSEMGSGGNTTKLARIDGGTGIDTLQLDGSRLTLDLTHIANQAANHPLGGSRIDNIETIDLTGSGNNTLKLTAADVLDLGSANLFADTGRLQLKIEGNTGDKLNLADGYRTSGWTQDSVTTANGITYDVWNHNTSLATLYVEQVITVL